MIQLLCCGVFSWSAVDGFGDRQTYRFDNFVWPIGLCVDRCSHVKCTRGNWWEAISVSKGNVLLLHLDDNNSDLLFGKLKKFTYFAHLAIKRFLNRKTLFVKRWPHRLIHIYGCRTVNQIVYRIYCAFEQVQCAFVCCVHAVAKCRQVRQKLFDFPIERSNLKKTTKKYNQIGLQSEIIKKITLASSIFI